MAKKEEQQLAAIVEDAVQEDRRSRVQRMKMQALEKTAAVAEKTKRKALQLYQRAQEEPNKPQIFVALGAASAGAATSFWASGFMESKTTEWVTEEGDSTLMRKLVVHGMFPIIGAAGMFAGCYFNNGLLSSGLIGLGAGLALGSLLRSVLVDEPEQV